LIGRSELRGFIVIAVLLVSSCTATDVDLPPPPPAPPAPVAVETVPQTEVRPVPEMPDLSPAGGFARTVESPLAGRRSGIADDLLERRLDCSDEPVPSDRDVRNAFLRRCPPDDRH
jgi:hypothetical protein